ncbi:MauE/DoxX family redox-associated membrane protein [Actinomadura flavalba]|uniref:MauE/DoxX family redox-associated membrane protein n=1 Tax=Actinomadura flavalba TaxID=1120938 RepID=UPI00037D4F6B|nr:MauE/DoxX family redox-associated membrane protein [Actinomadura flavalba]
MTIFLSAAGTFLVVLVLAAGAAGHVRSPGVLGAALRTHGALPSFLVRPLAVAVPAAEAAITGVALCAFAAGSGGVLRAALVAAAVLTGGYAIYTGYIARTRENVPCGCSSASGTLTGWVALRAGVLAAIAAGAALGADAAVRATGSETVVTALAGAVFAALLWEAPALADRPARAVG